MIFNYRKLLFFLFFFLSFLFFIWSNQFIVTIILILLFDSLTMKFIIKFVKNNLHYTVCKVLKYTSFILSLVFIALFCRVFLFEFYLIPSTSMEKTLLKGDVVIAEKLSLGPKIPKDFSEIPFGEFFFKKKTMKEKNKRLKGFCKIKRNDIIVFKKNKGNRTYIKRVIGMPNETLKIVDSKVFINKKKLAEEKQYVFEYKFKGRNFKKGFILLSNEEYQEFNLKDQIERNIFPKKSKIDEIFPQKKLFDWNRDNYGSVWIPKKDEAIILNEELFFLYKSIIEEETGEEIKHLVDSNSFLLGNKRLKRYVFKCNYYFVLGDNRHYSRDSRAIGFISENFILGKLFFKL